MREGQKEEMSLYKDYRKEKCVDCDGTLIIDGDECIECFGTGLNLKDHPLIKLLESIYDASEYYRLYHTDWDGNDLDTNDLPKKIRALFKKHYKAKGCVPITYSVDADNRSHIRRMVLQGKWKP